MRDDGVTIFVGTFAANVAVGRKEVMYCSHMRTRKRCRQVAVLLSYV